MKAKTSPMELHMHSLCSPGYCAAGPGIRPCQPSHSIPRSRNLDSLDLQTSPSEDATYVEARTLRPLIRKYSGSPTAIKAALEVIIGSRHSRAMFAVEPDRPAVMLVAGTASRNIPTIYLDNADGTAPTIHLDTWSVLGRPIWRSRKVFVCLRRLLSNIVHERSRNCEDCVVAGWMNAGAQLMLQNSARSGETFWDWKESEEWVPEKTKKKGLKGIFGTVWKYLRGRKTRKKSVWD